MVQDGLYRDVIAFDEHVTKFSATLMPTSTSDVPMYAQNENHYGLLKDDQSRLSNVENDVGPLQVSMSRHLCGHDCLSLLSGIDP